MWQAIYIGLAALALALAGLHLTFLAWFWQLTASLESSVQNAPAPKAMAGEIPNIVRAFALRAGVNPDKMARSISLEQSAELKMDRDGAWQPLDARQSISIAQAGFVWEARQTFGPITRIRIIDAYTGGIGQLQARLLGSIPVANSVGEELNRSELMRYLAELAWAPDALLGNPSLRWKMIKTGVVEVSIAHADGPVSVRLIFDDAGDIVEMQAKDRPVREADGALVWRDWRGYFSDYGQMGGRRIPRKGEVGYLYDDGTYDAYWRGRITEYVLHR
ncbi:MAG: hypothetical protein L3J30_01180 [Marinosulfonomonas sp.]|nr:hypothetical protein [Marinosulfonomonas sp.]